MLQANSKPGVAPRPAVSEERPVKGEIELSARHTVARVLPLNERAAVAIIPTILALESLTVPVRRCIGRSPLIERATAGWSRELSAVVPLESDLTPLVVAAYGGWGITDTGLHIVGPATLVDGAFRLLAAERDSVSEVACL